MALSSDIQKLEVGEYVEVFVLDAEAIGAGTYRFHNYDVGSLYDGPTLDLDFAAVDGGPTLELDFSEGDYAEGEFAEQKYLVGDAAHLIDAANGSIRWQGERYDPWPLEASGFEMSGNRNPTPTLKMGNVGGFITALCLQFDDLVGAKLTRKRTLAKYLDGRPDADPDEEFPPDIWYVEQKISENSEVVEFELSSAMDFQDVQLPARQINANFCPWVYRGADCGYTGGPVADEFDIITSDAARDKCGKRVQSCKLRFGEFGELPFGSFPAASLTR